MQREEDLGLEGLQTHVNDDGVFILCDTPEFRLGTAIVAGLNRGNAAYSIELLEFGSAADRDAHFAAIEECQGVCEATLDETFENERIETDPGRLLVYSTIQSWPGGSNSCVSHVTTAGATGMLSIDAENLDRVHTILA